MCSDAGVVVGDIVEFTADDLCTVGIVEKIRDDYVMILPLVRREGMGEECYVDESQPMFTVSRDVCRSLNVYPSQRVAWSTASPHHNPHGEESEDCYFIEDSVADNCVIPVKYISDT
ncbi:hypothetical protein GUITHDRAFT_110233 [Guillardia theta CCMP2712]|uniref:Uncharacterized protein n=1 Tax=Guillardia theta (strain CCMP2712) TaxID=905079 RepID=L1J5H9_GUITC|nr:hypothetical protein GUITHDRAFT_110233 [Guillardia theta CCMP2712]EKX43778.1 hypothetical protein GUITHDRAFT_110233 [Guillardia theta CCMP2712]|eukprot:XP_005830758.1 hypothetical protein GUITHDRAFT_110233 [Guillardia theta CCMP2712]